MKTYKQFFNEQEYDVAAKPVDQSSGYEHIGRADAAALSKIKRRSQKYEQKAEDTIKNFLDTIGFGDENYTNSFDNVLDKYNADYISLANYLKNKNRQRQLKVFAEGAGAKGDVDIFNQLNSRNRVAAIFGIPSDQAYNLYRDLCTIKHAQSRTAVGEAEFMLGVLTEGQKGKTGDIGATIRSEDKEYEIGTQNKVISKPAELADDMYVTVPRNKKDQSIQIGNIWSETEENNYSWTSEYLNELIAPGQDSVDFTGVERFSQQVANNERQSGTVDYYRRHQIFGAAQLYKYILNHNDNFIVIFDAGAKISSRKAAPFTRCRYYDVKSTPFTTLLNDCLNGWFTFSIDKDKTIRIMYR